MAILLVKDFMSRNIVTAPVHASVFTCVKTLAKHNIGALLIMQGREVAGIFTERDVIRRVLAKGLNMTTTPVKEVMTKDVVTAPSNSTLLEICNIMDKHHFRHLAIVDKSNNLSIVTATDLIKIAAPGKRAKVHR